MRHPYCEPKMLMLFFLALALVGFFLSLVVHFSTFGSQPMLMERAWPLHIGVFVVVAPMVIAQRRWGDPSAWKQKGSSIGDLFTLAPRWARTLATLCFFYAIVNFALFAVYGFAAERDGNFTTRDGRHVIARHNQIVRTVSDAEFRYHEARVARGFSGHWMLFYGLSAIGLYDAILRKRRAETSVPFDAGQTAVAFAGRRFAGRSPRLSPFAHSTLHGLVAGFGFLAAPISMVLLFLPLLHQRSGWGCCFVPVFFGSAIVGGAGVSYWFQHSVPARCPTCGGRAFGTQQPRSQGGHWTYRCVDCEAQHLV